jgi:hypothetical protein
VMGDESNQPKENNQSGTGARRGPGLGAGYGLLGTGYWVLVIGYWLLDTGHWTLVIRHWSFVTGHWLGASVKSLGDDREA